MNSTNREIDAPDAVAGIGNDLSMDMADLISILLASSGPDRDVDLIVQAMLGGKAPVFQVKPSTVRAGFWLKNQVPAFTSEKDAVNILAHRRGYCVETHESKGVWFAETRNLATGSSIIVKHSNPCVAAIIGIATLTSREVRK